MAIHRVLSQVTERIRRRSEPTRSRYHHGPGRERFGVFRANALGAEQGAMSFVAPDGSESIPTRSMPPVHDRFVFAGAPSPSR